MKRCNSETGAVIMLMALLSVVIMILISVAFDVWSFETDTIRMQTASDAGTWAAGMVLTSNLEEDEITAIAMLLAAEINRFNLGENPYEPAKPAAERESILDAGLRAILDSEGIPATSIDSCMARIYAQDITLSLEDIIDPINTALDHDDCISDTVKGSIRIGLLKEVGESVARDNLLASNFSPDEIDSVRLAVKDASGDDAASPADIQLMGVEIDAQSEVYLANHVIGLSTADHIPRRKYAAGQKAFAAIVLVVDVSGSMAPSMGDLKEAALNFAEEFAETENSLAIVGFSNHAETFLPLERDFNKAEYESEIEGLTAEGWTNTDDALRLAQAELSKTIADNMTKIVVLITDGQANGIAEHEGFYKEGYESDWNPICRTDQMRDAKAIVYAIGFGGVDDDFLKRVAFHDELPRGEDFEGTCIGTGIQGLEVRSYEDLEEQGLTEGRYYRSPNSSKLDSLLQAIAGKIKFKLTQ